MSTKKNLLIPEAALSDLKNGWLLLDTDVIIDAAKFADSFDIFFSDLEQADCTVVTISSVVVEFLRGAKSIKDMRAKTSLIENIATVIPTGEMTSNMGAVDLIDPGFLVAYGREAKGVSYTDYLLGKTVKNFEGKMWLMTGNHKDFPATIFQRDHIVTLNIEDDVRAYSILGFSKERYGQTLNVLLSQQKN